MVDNVVFPGQRELDLAIPTLGRRLRDVGYHTSYVGKLHLSHAVSPDLEAYGFSDWTGNDRHYMGWAGTGVEFIRSSPSRPSTGSPPTLRARSRGSS